MFQTMRITTAALLISLLALLNLPAHCGTCATSHTHAEPKHDHYQEGDVIVYAQDPAQGFVFNNEHLKSWFVGDFVRWASKDVGQIPQKDAYLFVGSSSMAMWREIHQDLAPLKIIHRGFGGSQMKDVVLFQDFLARYQCKEIIVYEGDNDLNQDPSSVDRFIENCKTFVAYIHATQPQVKIHFISPKPSPSRMPANDSFIAARTQLKAYTEATDKVHYIDVATPMLDADGNPLPDIFKGDRLHMNRKGYEIWTRVLREHFHLDG